MKSSCWLPFVEEEFAALVSRETPPDLKEWLNFPIRWLYISIKLAPTFVSSSGCQRVFLPFPCALSSPPPPPPCVFRTRFGGPRTRNVLHWDWKGAEKLLCDYKEYAPFFLSSCIRRWGRRLYFLPFQALRTSLLFFHLILVDTELKFTDEMRE